MIHDIIQLHIALRMMSRKLHQRQVNMGTRIGYTFWMAGYNSYGGAGSSFYYEYVRRDDVANAISYETDMSYGGQCPAASYIDGKITITDFSWYASNQNQNTEIYDELTKVWIIRSEYPTYHEFATRNNTGNYAFATQGKQNGNIISRYDNIARTYLNYGPVGLPNAEGSAGATVHDRLITGGGNSHQDDFYSVDTVTFSIRNFINGTYTGSTHHGLWTSAFSYNNVVYYNGGGGVTTAVSSFVDTTGVISRFMEMLNAKRMHGSAECDGYGFAAGSQGAGNRQSCDRIDIISQVTTTRLQYNETRSGSQMASTQHSLI